MRRLRAAFDRSHPPADPVRDLAPIQLGEVWENPVTRERATLIELPWHNPDGRGVAELTALVGSRVVGEHRHPNLAERFTVLQGKLTVRLNGQTFVLHEGQSSEVRPGQWHDWWNASDTDALVRVEVIPSERFLHMIETLFGLAQLGYTNKKGMPSPLQLAAFGREFSDVVEFRSPPPVVQKAAFAVLGKLAEAVGYRGTYPLLSRSVYAPRPPTSQS
jgi:mannose-6-phosphate isomerase-like protein (cupin superfamily)